MTTAPFLSPLRDRRLSLGRAKASGGTLYYTIPGVVTLADTTSAQLTDADVYTPWWTPSPIVVTKLAFEVSTSHASNCRVGFYAADEDWQPVGPPLADSGDISVGTTGIKTYSPGTPVFCPPGKYVSVSNCSGSPTFKSWQGWVNMGTNISTTDFTKRIHYLRVTRTYAAFPTPGTKWDTVSDSTLDYMEFWLAYEVTSV